MPIEQNNQDARTMYSRISTIIDKIQVKGSLIRKSGGFLSALLIVAVGMAPPSNALDQEEGISGEVNIGGSLATGNTDTTRLDAEFKARFKAGRLKDNYRLLVELAEDNGTTTAQRILGSVESRLDVQEKLFVFGFLEYDDDRFSGFKFEIEGAFGAGYKVVNDSNMRLLVQAGPGYRLSKLSVLGTAQDEFVVRGSADFEYQFSDSSSLTSTSIVTWDSSRTTLENTIALTSDLFGGLSSRLSFNVRYNSDPPALTRKTDTLSKVSLVYGF